MYKCCTDDWHADFLGTCISEQNRCPFLTNVIYQTANNSWVTDSVFAQEINIGKYSMVLSVQKSKQDVIKFVFLWKNGVK